MLEYLLASVCQLAMYRSQLPQSGQYPVVSVPWPGQYLAQTRKYVLYFVSVPPDACASTVSTVLVVRTVCNVPDDACASVGQVPAVCDARCGVVVCSAPVSASANTVLPVHQCPGVRASTVLPTVWSTHLSTGCVTGNTYTGDAVSAVTGSASGVQYDACASCVKRCACREYRCEGRSSCRCPCIQSSIVD